MITFACRKIKIEEIIRCALALNKTEYNVFMFLLDKGQSFRAIEIAKNLNVDRTTVQKALKSLLEKNLIRRIQKNLVRGGYVFLYSMKDKEEIKKRVIEIIERWYNAAVEKIKKL